jgi:hypothetical protein
VTVIGAGVFVPSGVEVTPHEKLIMV